MAKQPHELSFEELSALACDAGKQAVQMAFEKGLPVSEWDEERGEVMLVYPSGERKPAGTAWLDKPPLPQAERKALKAAS